MLIPLITRLKTHNAQLLQNQLAINVETINGVNARKFFAMCIANKISIPSPLIKSQILKNYEKE